MSEPMHTSILSFRARADVALADPTLKVAIDRTTGTAERNAILRAERAEHVLRQLDGLRFAAVMLSPRPATDVDGAANTRTVRFRVLLADTP